MGHKHNSFRGGLLKDKVNWMNVLHFYQPPFQEAEIVQRVTEECYLPVIRTFLERPHARAVININGCLLEHLDSFQKGKEVIQNLRSLISSGQLEIMGTGKYHPIFPLINAKEIKIQILRQEMSLQSFLGINKMPTLLFLPELAYWPEQTPVFEEQGYSWIIIDEISLKNGKPAMGKSRFREKGGQMNLLVRERDLSESLGNFPWRIFDIQSSGDFIKHSRHQLKNEKFVVTASDAEVFGHHQKERWKLLADIYDSRSVNSITTREIVEEHEWEEVETIPASWSTSSEDISRRIYYPLWHHPQNRLHRLLWQLLDLTTDEVRSKGSASQNKTMDGLFSSCPFFRASCMPWWNGIIVEKAADSMFNLISEVEGVKERIIGVARSITDKVYNEVTDLNVSGTAEELQNKFFRSHKMNRKDIYHLLH